VWKTLNDPTFAALTAIRHWPDKTELARFAGERHGFGDSDGGFGVTYPDDLDEHEWAVKGRSIPPGFALAYGFWGPPEGYEVLVPEWLYRDVLAEVLECLGLSHEASSVRVPEGWLGPA
jgi:attachment invasion locus protein